MRNVYGTIFFKNLKKRVHWGDVDVDNINTQRSLEWQNLCAQSTELAFIYVMREITKYHVTKHNTPIHNTLSIAPQLSICQKALGTLPEDGNAMPKHVGATIHN
jgi:hypothetical protein